MRKQQLHTLLIAAEWKVNVGAISRINACRYALYHRYYSSNLCVVKYMKYVSVVNVLDDITH